MRLHLRLYTANLLNLQYATAEEREATFILMEHGALTPDDAERIAEKCAACAPEPIVIPGRAYWSYVDDKPVLITHSGGVDSEPVVTTLSEIRERALAYDETLDWQELTAA